MSATKKSGQVVYVAGDRTGATIFFIKPDKPNDDGRDVFAHKSDNRDVTPYIGQRVAFMQVPSMRKSVRAGYKAIQAQPI